MILIFLKPNREAANFLLGFEKKKRVKIYQSNKTIISIYNKIKNKQTCSRHMRTLWTFFVLCLRIFICPNPLSFHWPSENLYSLARSLNIS